MTSRGSDELASETLGARIRSLREAAGMSQVELAGGRFSKAYVSQIERGKTRPTRETLEWLAGRLATERDFLEIGVSRADAERVETALAVAEAQLEGHRHDEALEAFRSVQEMSATVATPAFSLRLLRGKAWTQIRLGNLDAARTLLDEAAVLSVSPGFSDVDRADVVFSIGVCRYSVSNVSEAIVFFDQALTMAESSVLPCDRLRSDIFHWRSRCHRRLRDWVAAREDIERALELAQALPDSRRTADAYFQASLVAQREGRWVLARTHAERSKVLFEQLGDRPSAARLLNNLAGLNHLLGHPERAIALLHEAFDIFVEFGLTIEAAYVSSSLADIHLDGDDFESAEAEARKALHVLVGRTDHLQEVGTAQLALGRALAGQGRLEEAEDLIATADKTFEQASSASHRADAWIAQGDLETRRGDDREAAQLYRRAAQALQEPNF